MGIKVGVIGYRGRLGQMAMEAIDQDPDLECGVGIGRGDQVEKAIASRKIDVVLDVSTHLKASQHAEVVIGLGVPHVIGASGLDTQKLKRLAELARKHHTPCLWAPNFSIGACLMMRFAEMAAPYFEDVDIIEMHHKKKQDKPSGTAYHTAALVHAARCKKQGNIERDKVLQAEIHSLRSSGFLASQQVICANTAEVLQIKHRCNDRSAFKQGIRLALHQVARLEGLVIGLERILFAEFG